MTFVTRDPGKSRAANLQHLFPQCPARAVRRRFAVLVRNSYMFLQLNGATREVTA
jgi:hypothetical protein